MDTPNDDDKKPRTRDEDPGPAPAPEGLGCIALVSLFLACTAGPLAVALLLGPTVGLLAADGAIALWIGFGPRPFPGLLPGVLSIVVILQNAAVIVYCVAQISSAALR